MEQETIRIFKHTIKSKIRIMTTTETALPAAIQGNRFRDITGQRFGRLMAVSPTDARESGRVVWLCLCDCGNNHYVQSNSLLTGKTKSCGCLNLETRVTSNTKHGQGGGRGKKCTTEYHSWQSMKQRCYAESNEDYPNYGGRGITVCERWLHSFENFFSDMGKKPSMKYSIDRINPNGNYEPVNCRWGTDEQQTRNKRSNIWIYYNGSKMIQADFCKLIGADKGSVRKYLKTKTGDEIALYYLTRKNKNEKLI